MGYLHIDNLYKDQRILAFRECYALEKVHGTSAHIAFAQHPVEMLTFFAGGVAHADFVALFDESELRRRLAAKTIHKVVVYGEAYGGKCQGMRHTYGDKLRFVVFDVMVEDRWLSVPDAADWARSLGLEFVHYERIACTMEEIDRCRDLPVMVPGSETAAGPSKGREGVVLRPIFEASSNGGRIITKHKRDAFRETKTPRVVDPGQQQVLRDADAVADEWVTPMRLRHVVDRVVGSGQLDPSQIPAIRDAMIEDVQREGAGEIVWSREVQRAVSTKACRDFRSMIDNQLRDVAP